MKIHNHTEVQEQFLMQGIQGISMMIVNSRFDEPADDEKNMRRNCYLQGKKDQLIEMLRDDYPDPKAEAAAEQLHQQTQG